MGWTSIPATYFKNGKIDRKAECDAYFMEGLNRGNFKVLKSTMRGSVYYAAVKNMVKPDGGGGYIPIENGKVWAAVFLTSTEKGWFCYKDMDETYGPGYYDCPVSILNLLDKTTNEYALKWRKKCIETQKSKKEFSKLPVGSVISFKYMGYKEMKAYKHEPAYQFKRPFWMSMDGYHIPEKKIMDWKVVEQKA